MGALPIKPTSHQVDDERLDPPLEALRLPHCRIRGFRLQLVMLFVPDSQPHPKPGLCRPALQLQLREDWILQLCNPHRRIDRPRNLWKAE